MGSVTCLAKLSIGDGGRKGIVFALLCTLAAAIGCSKSDATPASATGGSAGAPTCDLGMPLTDGTCVTAGIPADQCAPGFKSDGQLGCDPLLPAEECPEGTMAVIGNTTCQPVGIPADKCAAGFSPDDKGGCVPVLPTVDCPMGQMAVPGETECHEPQACGTGTWGDIPIDATTQYVDAGYTGGASDGSLSKPWTTIQDALDAAPLDAVVAIAAGTYAEDVTIQQGVKLWGVCPSKVAILGSPSAAQPASLRIKPLPAGQITEVHGVSISGSKNGIAVLGTTGVSFSGLWVHDTGGASVGFLANGGAEIALEKSLFESTPGAGIMISGSTMSVNRSVIRDTPSQTTDGQFGEGIDVFSQNGKRGSLTLSDSLLERNHNQAIFVADSDITVERAVIRQTQAQTSNSKWGAAIYLGGVEGQRCTLKLSDSFIDQNHTAGVFNFGSDATIERTVIQNTQAQPDDQAGGIGIVVQNMGNERATLTLTDSVLEQNLDAGLFIYTSDATVSGTIIRDTQPMADNTLGVGVALGQIDGNPATLTMTRSLLDRNHDMGLYVFGASATLEKCTIQNTLTQVSDNMSGRGIDVEATNGVRAALTLTDSLLDHNQEVSLFIAASDATVRRCVIRNTLPAANLTNGGGVSVQEDGVERGVLTLEDSVIDQSFDVGLFAVDSDVNIQRTVVRNTKTRSSDQSFGDAISVIEANLTVDTAMLRNNGRASMSNFGSVVTLSHVGAVCSPILFDKEREFSDDAGHVIALAEATYQQQEVGCADCAGKGVRCTAVSEKLSAPKPVKPLAPSTP